MSKLKAMAAVLAVIAFFAYCMWLSPFLFGNRVRSEMTQDSILKYDSGANIYIASKDDNSKVYFGKSGSYKFYGTGALTYMESPKSESNAFRSGFNLLIEGGNLELKTGQADILTGSVSPNGQFLALLKIDGRLSIYNISTGKTTYESTESFIFANPLKPNNSSYPYFFWTDQGLIVQKKNTIESEENPKQPIENNNRDGNQTKEEQITMEKTEDIVILVPIDDDTDFSAFSKTLANTYKIKYESKINLIAVELSNGNTKKNESTNSNTKIIKTYGSINLETLFVSYLSIESNPPSKKYGVFNVKTSIIAELPDLPANFIGFSNGKLYFAKDNVLVCSIISPQKSSAPVSIGLPELDGEKLAPDKIENLRVTSKGYLHFRHIKTAKTYLLDPDTGVYVEIPKERYPY